MRSNTKNRSIQLSCIQNIFLAPKIRKGFDSRRKDYALYVIFSMLYVLKKLHGNANFKHFSWKRAKILLQ